MRIAYFTHAITSCWNNGNAHFQRGLLRELVQLGHDVVACEPSDGWSAANLVREHGAAALEGFPRAFPELSVVRYGTDVAFEALLDGADLVIVHEWTDEDIIRQLGSLRTKSGRFLLLFHDTHHRAVSKPEEMSRFDLSGFDGVLAFGQSLAEVYRQQGWGRRVYVLHEAADTRLFTPPEPETRERHGLVWIGNWGDEERTEEIVSFLLRPARDAGLALDIHGVRYPQHARDMLKCFGARYRGWIANAEVPAAFAHHLATVHVPRRYYANALPGIPTIRVFEALACGIPLVSAPWDDSEGLFVPGTDFLQVRTERQMRCALRSLRNDADLRGALSRQGHARIQSRHTCRHRAKELVAIVEELSAQPRSKAR